MKKPLDQEWRCRCCGVLLGISDEDYIEIRYKSARYRVRGEVTSYCRRCGTLSQVITTDVSIGDAHKAGDRSK